jgi:N-methylhydantoinase B
MAIDPVTLAVLKGALDQACTEMESSFVRAAFSPVIAEGQDMACGIYEADTGEVIAQGEGGLPIFIVTMQDVVQNVLSVFPEPRPGDVYLTNDPYRGGTHLMDVKLVRPYFYDGQLVCHLAATGHWTDVGGTVPGGYAPQATEIYQEGLRMPPLRLCSAGRIDENVLSLILANVRVPRQQRGDLEAQLGALEVGARRLTGLLDRHGVDRFRAFVGEMRAYAERKIRAYLAEIPAGRYSFEDYMDNDGHENLPLRIALDLTVDGGELTFDFARSSPPCRGPLNCSRSATTSACLVAMRHLFPDVPINAGSLRPFHFHIPESTFLNAQLPRPVAGAAAEVTQRVIDVVFGALAQALPDRVGAGNVGTAANLSLAGQTAAPERWVMYMWSGGGYGGSARGDGLTNGTAPGGGAHTWTGPAEVYEQRAPILFLRWELREESAGAGRWRGGFGVTRELMLRAGTASASFIGDRGRCRPFGLYGGQAGAPTEFVVVHDGQEYRPPMLTKVQAHPLVAGDRIRISTPGGGGYGDPLARPPESVAADVRAGYFSPARAAADYGVVVTAAGGLDWAATAELRATRQAAAEPRS